MSEPIENILQELLSVDTTSMDWRSNKQLLTIIQKQIGGEIISNPETHTPVLFHRPKGPYVLWIGHTDIIPIMDGQINQTVDGKMYARGTYDMKGSVAALIAVLQENPQLKDRLGFFINTDEEVGGANGAQWFFPKYLADDKLIECALVGEPTDLKLVTQSKGLLSYDVYLEGLSGHAARPWTGVNTTDALVDFINTCRQKIFTAQPQSASDWRTSYNFGYALSHAPSDKSNIIPDSAKIKVDVRYVPADDPQQIIEANRWILSELKQQHKIVDYELKVKMVNVPEKAAEDNELVMAFKESIKQELGSVTTDFGMGVSDGRHLAEVKPDLPIMRFGPAGAGAHAKEEFVEVESLYTYARILKGFLANRL